MNYSKTQSNYFFNVRKATLACLLFFFCFGAYAQTCSVKADKLEENNYTNLPSVYDFGGSTFVACKTGMITTISFKVTNESVVQPNAMFFVENGIGNGVIEGDSQTYADYSQGVSISGSGRVTTVRLSTPFPVQQGETYTWYVQKDPKAGAFVQAGAIDPLNGFDGGSAWYNNKYYRSMDNIFSVKIK